jgi:hypothetical protein
MDHPLTAFEADACCRVVSRHDGPTHLARHAGGPFACRARSANPPLAHAPSYARGSGGSGLLWGRSL